MQVNELKKIFEISSILGKGFSPITEYTYVKDTIVKVSNMESYIETVLDFNMPFNALVLSEKMSKFLTSMDKDVDLKFTVNANTLDITYGKRNKFTIPTEDLNSFPDSPSLKYSEKDLLCNIALSLEFIKTLEKASQFASKNDVTFCGVYLKNKKIYSSNREIIFINDMDIDYENFIFIPSTFIKLLLKFKSTFKTLEIYSCGFKAVGEGVTLYSSNYEQPNCPDFDALVKKYVPIFRIEATEEIRDILGRVSLFDEVVSINIKDNAMTISTPNITEVIEIATDTKEFYFKITTEYLKKLFVFDSVHILTKGEEEIKGLCGKNETTMLISTLVD